MEKSYEKFSYAKLKEPQGLPNLIETQLRSFQWFLDEGLKELITSIFPISDLTGNLILEFEDLIIDRPRYTIEECRDRDMHYAVPVRIKCRLLNKETGEIKQQEVLLGDFPIMTPNGTFIINGAERVVVSQLARSPGIYYKEIVVRGEGRTFYAKLIPNRGTWVELELDLNGALWIKIERSRRFPATLFLKALGFGSNIDIHKIFGKQEKIKSPTFSQLVGNIVLSDLIDPSTGEVILPANSEISEEVAKKESLFRRLGEIELIITSPYIRATMEHDSTSTEEEALLEIYRKIRPGEFPTVESARSLLRNLFFDKRRYDLGRVGRYKLNKKFNKDISNAAQDVTTLTKEDFLEMIKYLIKLREGEGETDDIDHLANRRVRSVGELLQNHLRIGFLRMEKVAKERMMIQDKESITPQSIINIRPIVAALNEFFGTSQLSQFMDQTNPLSELTHKRRLSALGPGGLSRERAGFEVRDVHHSHYGRICPIETPEGPNIGLINSLSTYARVNDLGFIETPYRRVIKGRVTDEIVYLTADDESKYVIAQANAPVGEEGYFIQDKVLSRYKRDHILADADKVDFMDVSPKQIISVSTALIPFLEHDDANRALMGSNMQRQAVPLVLTEKPLVKTEIEAKVAVDSGAVLIAKNPGEVVSINSNEKGNEIVIENNQGKKDYYVLRKFGRSNQGTCINQKPKVLVGDKVKKGEVIADGPSTSEGELSLGRNVLVAYMPWEGYNFEDAIIISEKLVKEDTFTSIHIEEYEVEARDTKLGPEEITRETPNISEEQLKDLDEDGIIRIGAEVQSEDILVGKITPKGETELTPEERLLRAIFGEKAREMRDTSLRVPHGGKGKVVDVRRFSREEGYELSPGVRELVRVYVAQKRKIAEGDKMAGRHGNKGVIARIFPEEDMPYLEDGTPVEIILDPLGVPSRMNIGQILEAHLGWAAHILGLEIGTPVFDGAREEEIKYLLAISNLIWRGEVKLYDRRTNRQVGILRLKVEGQDPRGSIGSSKEIAKLFQNSEILFYDREGKHLQATLKLVGISYKDIIESWVRGTFFSNFEVEREKDAKFTKTELKDFLKNALFKETGKMRLYDGKSGEPFEQEVTVGYIYMMKLAHLVEDKIHARSTGPYALVTQQPLGGRAQFGGQRFGEMEVWALEAYGAAYTLQELLTVKSDDVVGRVKTYEAIIKGENILEPGLPEGFKVLVKELQSLGIDVRLLSGEQKEIEIPEMEEITPDAEKELEKELT